MIGGGHVRGRDALLGMGARHMLEYMRVQWAEISLKSLWPSG